MKNTKIVNTIKSINNICEVSADIKPEHSFKVVFSGESAVGKTSIIKQETIKEFNSQYQMTTCFDHSYKNFEIGDTIIRIQIWDTSGQELYKSLILNFYRSSLLAFVVFALDDINSFEKCENWLKEVRNLACDDIPIFLIGNKSDKKEDRQIKQEIIDKFVNDNNITYYCECSAMNGDGIDKVFKEAIRCLYNTYVVPTLNNKLLNGYTDEESKTFELKDTRYKSNCKECLCCE